MVAEVNYEKGKYDQAIEYWDQVLASDKKNATALYMIGMSYQQKGGKENIDKGIILCKQAIKMDPSLGSKNQKIMKAGIWKSKK